jgi:hypothetical protein
MSLPSARAFPTARRGRSARRFLGLTAAAAAGIAGARHAQAAVSIWNGAAFGNWSDPAQWTGGVPNSASADAVIHSDVPLVDIPVTLDTLSLDNGTAVSFPQQSQSITLFGDATNNGTINLSGTGTYRAGVLTLAAAHTFGGTGTVSLGGAADGSGFVLGPASGTVSATIASGIRLVGKSATIDGQSGGLVNFGLIQQDGFPGGCHAHALHRPPRQGASGVGMSFLRPPQDKSSPNSTPSAPPARTSAPAHLLFATR